MTPQQFVGLGIRLFSVWLVLSSIRYFSSVPVAMARGGEIAERVYQAYIVGGAYLLAAVILWVFPMTVAHRLIPRTSFAEHMTIPAFAAARVGSALVGLWLFAKSATSLSWYLFSALPTRSDGSFLESMTDDWRVEGAVLIVEVGLSAFLIVRSSYFARLVLPAGEES